MPATMQDAIDALHTRMSRRVRHARAHDLNGLAQNILSATIGIQRVLKNAALLQSDERLRKCFQWIESSVTRISASAEDMLPLSAQHASAAIRIDYGQMLSDCARLARDVLGFADVKIDLQNLAEPCFLFAKAEQIRDIIFAVIFALSDAAQRPGQIDLRCEINDPFVMLRATTLRDAGGIAIDHSVDLIVARELARSHGGDLILAQGDSASPLITLRLPIETPVR